jgi:predicted dehydrogenase
MNFAVLGAGVMGSRYLDHLCDVGHDVSWVYDTNPAILADVRRRWEARPTNRLSDIHADAIIVASPTLTHEPLAHFAMAKARRVLVEKPVTTSPAAMNALRWQAESYGRVLYPALTLLHDHMTERAAEALEEAKPHRVKIVWQSTVERPEGVVWDLGPHPLSLIRRWWGTDYQITDAWQMPAGVGFRVDFENGLRVDVHLELVEEHPRREVVTPGRVLADFAGDVRVVRTNQYGHRKVYMRHMGKDAIDRTLDSFMHDDEMGDAMLEEGCAIVQNLNAIQRMAWWNG